MTSLIPDDNVRIMRKICTVRSVIKLIHCGNLLRKGWNHGGVCVWDSDALGMCPCMGMWLPDSESWH